MKNNGICAIGDNAEYALIGDVGNLTVVTVNSDGNWLYEVSGI